MIEAGPAIARGRVAPPGAVMLSAAVEIGSSAMTRATGPLSDLSDGSVRGRRIRGRPILSPACYRLRFE